MLLALARAIHPGPAATVTAVAVLLGVAVGLEPRRVALLGLAVALDQCSVGWSNDWIDAERDRAVGRRDKPVALGLVSVALVRALAIAAAAAALLATIPLGPAAVLVHAVGLGSAWSYNALLKRTPLSPLPYAVSFGLLPALPALALPAPALPAWWAVAAGGLLGIAAHFANALPDLDDDRRTGVLGLPHRLPVVASVLVTWGALLLAAALLALGAGALAGSAAPIAGLVIAAGLTAAGLALSLRRPSRWGFRLVLVAALVDVVLLLAAGADIVVR